MDKRELSVYSQAGWIELSDAFPPSSPSDAGKVLAVGEDGKPEWAEGSGGLPSTGSASAGDVLSLDEDKEPVWSAPSGGGGDVVFFESDDEKTSIEVGGSTIQVYLLHVLNSEERVKGADVLANPTKYIYIVESQLYTIGIYDPGEGGANFKYYAVGTSTEESFSYGDAIASGNLFIPPSE